MKRIDLLKEKDKIFFEIQRLKKISLDEKHADKSFEINDKIKKLKKKYDFVRLLLKVNKQ